MSDQEFNAEQDRTSESEDLEPAAESPEDLEQATESAEDVEQATESADDLETVDELVDASPGDEPEDAWASDDAGAAIDDADSETVHDGALWEDSPISTSPTNERDPWVRILLVTALSLVVVLLVTTVAFYFYTNTLNDAPRTAAEHAIAKAEVASVESPKYIGSWRDLAYAYAGAGRYDDALAAAAKGEKLNGGATLATVRGNILMMAGRDQEAVRAYDRAEVKVKEFLERVKTERAKVGISVEIDNDLLFAVYYGRAGAKRAVGDDAGAIKDYEAASKENPNQTDVWVGLGELYEKAGETDKARAAYERALQFVDDLKPALDGLKRVGKGE